MGRGWSLLIAAALGAPLLHHAAADEEPPAVPPAAADRPAPPATAPADLPPAVLAALAGIEDFSYNFDHPGYYALLAFVKRGGAEPGMTYPPVEVADWREFVERPAEFRGRAVTITGVIGRNKDPYTHAHHPQLGPVWQVELSRPDLPLSATVIFTNDVSDLPLGATIRLTGYFVKINRYPTPAGRPGLAALLISPGPTQISLPAATTTGDAPDWRWLMVAVALGLLAAYVLLRRSVRPRVPRFRDLQPSRPAPLNLAQDLSEWAAQGDSPSTAQGDSPPTEERQTPPPS